MNPILSRHYPSCCASASRFPYVGRISVGEKDVNFVYQFTKKNVTQNPNNAKFEEQYITGTPIKFPTYEDFPRAFCMRNFGFDISTSPWQDKIELYYIYTTLKYKLKCFKNHVDILFHEAVYPIRVSVYEIYNPGNIIRIWAQDSDSESDQWFMLWNGSPQIVPPASRLFSPPLESCSFKTKKLRLEFKRSSWDYYTKIDAVMLIGTSKLILPRNPEESITNLLKRIQCMHFHHENEDVHNLTTDYKKAHLDIVHLQQNFDEYCIIQESDIEKIIYKSNLSLRKVSQKTNSDFVQPFTQKHSRRLLLKNDLSSAKRIKLSSDESKELPRYSLSIFPDEIILKILENLDLITLCRLNQVNKRFYNITQDFALYKRLNVRNICHTNICYTTCMCNIFRYFTPRCENLQQLDLAVSDFIVSDFVAFLDNCGNCLTHLRLSGCSVNDCAMREISRICKNLKHLDLGDCNHINDKGFSYLEKLQRLEHLNVSVTNIKTARLCKILQRNQQIRQLHLEGLIINLDKVAIHLRNSCKNLEVINLDFSRGFLTSEGINALADCKHLRKVKLRDVYCDFFQDGWNRLFSSCQNLEEIVLSDVNNRTLESLTQCQNLKRLHLYNSMSVASDEFSVIFEQCPKLQEFYLIFCNTNTRLINQWRERYPHVFIYVESFKEFPEFIIQE